MDNFVVMDIEHYISQLLYRYQCVAVPSFGAFLTSAQSARFLENSNSFLPPRKVITFNPNLNNNDGLLANHIAIYEKTSYEAALKIIESEVYKWQNILASSETLLLKNIGVFEFNEERNLMFKPNDQVNYLTTSFGLHSFVSPLIERVSSSIENEYFNDKEYGAKVIELEPLSTKKTYNYLKYASVLVISLGLTGSICLPLYQNKIENDTAMVKQAVQRQIQNKIQEATFFIEPALTKATVLNTDSKLPYHIMSGAFRNEKNAQIELEILINQGFKARIMSKNQYGYYSVIYGSYSTIVEAETAKKQIRNSINPEAWLVIESF